MWGTYFYKYRENHTSAAGLSPAWRWCITLVWSIPIHRSSNYIETVTAPLRLGEISNVNKAEKYYYPVLQKCGRCYVLLCWGPDATALKQRSNSFTRVHRREEQKTLVDGKQGPETLKSNSSQRGSSAGCPKTRTSLWWPWNQEEKLSPGKLQS